jgi:large conductance mechanosensitive channel
MSILSDFKAFAVKGNVVDLAVAVIIGGAFGKIVTSLVSDIIMPVVGALIGKMDFSNFFIPLGTVPAGTAMTLEAVRKANVPVLAYGDFITILINFLILAFIIFLMVRMISKLKHAEPPAPPPADPEEILLLREIRDALKR